jgi:hypothetical protein
MCFLKRFQSLCKLRSKSERRKLSRGGVGTVLRLKLV